MMEEVNRCLGLSHPLNPDWNCVSAYLLQLPLQIDSISKIAPSYKKMIETKLELKDIHIAW